MDEETEAGSGRLLINSLGNLTDVDPTPRIWIKPESASTPWANVTIQCLSINSLGSTFELLRDGKPFASLPILDPIVMFPLGPVTADNKGTYQCHIREKTSWTATSAPVEVTGTEPLPAPSITAEPGPWILQGVKTELHCQGTLLGMTFDLYQEGEPEPVASSLPPQAEAIFLIKSPGNYTCRYRAPTAAPRVGSAPSQPLHFVVPGKGRARERGSGPKTHTRARELLSKPSCSWAGSSPKACEELRQGLKGSHRKRYRGTRGSKASGYLGGSLGASSPLRLPAPLHRHISLPA
uniref:Ig-like domain-containing protein n=1 Tax=Sarcophilus harrisii TaxID=9305 RepID=A0A7N4NJD3_SARHA